MAAADGYDAAKLAAGTVSITKAPSTAQKKLTAAIGTDKKTVTVSAAKGTPKGQTTYFLLVYNTSSTSAKKGYVAFFA